MGTALGNLTSGVKDWYQDDFNGDAGSIKGWINDNKDSISSSYNSALSGTSNSTTARDTTYDGLLTSAFKNNFGREPTEEGLAWWGSVLADPSNNITVDNLNESLINGAQGDDLTYLYNKANNLSNGTNIGTGTGTDTGTDTGTGTSDTSSTVFGTLISNLQGEIDSGKFDQSDFLADYQNDLDNYSANIDAYTDQAIAANDAVYRDSIDPAVQGVLNKLASKNMINSSVSGDTLSKTLSSLASDNANVNAEIVASGIQNKLSIPEMKAAALTTSAATAAQALLPYETLLSALEIDMYKYTNALS